MRTIMALFLGLALLLSFTARAEPALGFTYDGKTYGPDNLPPALQQKLHELDLDLHNRRQQMVDEYVLNRYLRETAQRENKSIRQLQQELFTVAEPPEQQLRDFYNANQSRIPGSFEEVKAQLAQYMKNQAVAQKQVDLLDKLRKEHGYTQSLSAPAAPRFKIAVDGYPSKGAADAAILMVEFADYQCPHCKNAVAAVDKLLQRYEGKLRLVYRDFPVNSSGISRKVAMGAYCAGQQGRFWEYHDLAFERQDYLKVVTPEMLAAEIKLDTDAFAQCFESPASAARVDASEAEAVELGLTGTPAFFVNGRRLHIHSDIEKDLIEAIEQELGSSS